MRTIIDLAAYSARSEEGRKDKQDCKKRNLVYEISCRTCRERKEREIEEKYEKEGKKRIDEEKRKLNRFIYFGETNRSAHERGAPE